MPFGCMCACFVPSLAGPAALREAEAGEMPCLAKMRGPASLRTYDREYDDMNDTGTRIAALLQQVGEVHHTVFADTSGADDDWATFYSDWLLTHSECPSCSDGARCAATLRAIGGMRRAVHGGWDFGPMECVVRRTFAAKVCMNRRARGGAATGRKPGASQSPSLETCSPVFLSPALVLCSWEGTLWYVAASF